jgi:hypothetical protein
LPWVPLAQGHHHIFEVSFERDVKLVHCRDNAFDSNEEIDAKLLINYFDSTQEGKLLYAE